MHQSNKNIAERLFSRITFELFDFIAPKVCLACDAKINFNEDKHLFLCANCLTNLPYLIEYEGLINRLAVKFGYENVALRRLNALLDISKERKYLNVIHSFKYQGMQESAFVFGKMLGKKLQSDDFTDYNAIIPLPIHHARKRERGYNQAYYISLGVSEILNIPTVDTLVKRVRYTTTQTKLNAEQRAKNLTNAFKANDNLKDMRILLIDDVLTTGSTLNNCAAAIKITGAEFVDAATIAAG